jgi:hypothetical protein
MKGRATSVLCSLLSLPILTSHALYGLNSYKPLLRHFDSFTSRPWSRDLDLPSVMVSPFFSYTFLIELQILPELERQSNDLLFHISYLYNYTNHHRLLMYIMIVGAGHLLPSLRGISGPSLFFSFFSLFLLIVLFLSTRCLISPNFVSK